MKGLVKGLGFQSVVLVAVACAGTTMAQTTLHTTTTLVVVPTLVQTADKGMVYSLTASDFVVTDNGIPQKVILEEEAKRPLSLVVLIQTGGAARGQFPSYVKLETMLDSVLGGSPNRVAIANFDSRVVGVSPFASDISQWSDAINKPVAGDNGVAIFDGIAYALELLKKEPVGNRRAILLISQEHDNGSKTTLPEVVRDLGESNAVVYSVTFSAEKTAVKQAFKDSPQLNPPIQVVHSDSPIQPVNDPAYPTQGYFNLDAPLRLIIGAMRKDLSAEVAQLSGGDSIRFDGRGELEAAVDAIGSRLRNTYFLSFSPTSNEPGVHTIKVSLPRHPEMIVSARTSYWTENSSGR
ncbi:MAG TPA: VWA domain-containing protein [Edaphobacter sp.]|jgi:VWFA-related protein|nr:VWA domain-containing protein [Edaphobacter sp.]